MEEKNKPGRKPYWIEELKQTTFNSIIERVSQGESIRSILDKADRKEYPSNRVFLEWVAENDIFSKQYTRAMEERTDKLFEELLIIADDQENDVTVKPDGTEYVNHNIINRNKLQIDTRKWVLSRMNPKKYGDKVENTNTNINLDTESISKESTESLIKRANAIKTINS